MMDLSYFLLLRGWIAVMTLAYLSFFLTAKLFPLSLKSVDWSISPRKPLDHQSAQSFMKGGGGNFLIANICFFHKSESQYNPIFFLSQWMLKQLSHLCWLSLEYMGLVTYRHLMDHMILINGSTCCT